MSRKTYTDDCPNCRPALVNLQTGKLWPMDSPPMQAVMAIWANTPRAEREVFHRVTCLNSRAPHDLAVMTKIVTRMKAVLVPQFVGHT